MYSVCIHTSSLARESTRATGTIGLAVMEDGGRHAVVDADVPEPPPHLLS
jgi:hypothetical protein